MGKARSGDVVRGREPVTECSTKKAIRLSIGLGVSIILLNPTAQSEVALPVEKQEQWQVAEEAAARHTDADAAYSAALTAYSEGRYHEAFTLISRLFKQSPDSEALNFALGSSAYAIGKLSHASVAFERVIALNPDNQRARLELARTYAAMGQFTLARETFESVLQTLPPPVVRENVERYLEKIADAQRQWKVSASVGAGVFYDDNVNVGPKADFVRIQPVAFGPVIFDELSVASQSKPQESFGAFALVHGTVEYDPGMRGRWSLFNHATYYETILEGNQDTFDTIFARNVLGLRHSGYRTLAELSGAFTYIEREDDEFAVSYGLQSVFAYAPSARDRWITSASLEKRDYHKVLDPDSVYIEVGESYAYRLESHPAEVRFGVAGFFENARADQYDNVGVRASLGATYSLPWNLRLAGQGAYQFATYDERELIAPTEREDDQWRLALGVTRPVAKNTNLSLQYNYTRNDSSFDLYEYDRSVVTMSVDHSL